MSDGSVMPFLPGSGAALGLPAHRAKRHSKNDLKALEKKYAEGPKGKPISQADLDQIWNELKKPDAAIRVLDIDRLPSDALAFYRPFHFYPHEEWGIYLLIEPMLAYCERLHMNLKPHLKSFNQETLMGCLLFEVFHHEFFHHLTECAATTLEIISASFGPPRPVLRNYLKCRFDKAPGLGTHPHHPLEEALANSYAYNSFSFLSRMQIGFKLAWVKLYQKVLQQCWRKEPRGYRSAAEYIDDRYVSGAAQLMAMLMESADLDPASLMLLAKAVMPNGNSAFLAKPEVPTYLVGDAEILKTFNKLIPAPNETYTSLYWLGSTSEVDKYLRERQKKEAEERKALQLSKN
jgi:hypothetical protein